MEVVAIDSLQFALSRSCLADAHVYANARHLRPFLSPPGHLRPSPTPASHLRP